MKKLVAVVAVALVVGLAGSASVADEYMTIGTQENGGGGIYSTSGGALTFVNSIAAVPGFTVGVARHAYYHEANDTLYFTEADKPAEFSLVLQDALDNGLAATATKLNGFDANGGGEAHPDIMVKGPQDGEIYAHTRGAGWIHHYDPVTDVATKQTITAYVDSKVHNVVYGNTLYTNAGGSMRAWNQIFDGTWGAVYDPGMSGMIDSHATAVRASDGMYFTGRSGVVHYGDFDNGAAPVDGMMWKLDPIRDGQAYNSLEVSLDGTKLWVGFPGMIGFYDISGPSAAWHENGALWTTVIAPGGTPQGLVGGDWRISFLDAVDGGGEVIPEPAGLGLVGLALLAVRRRRS